MNSINIIIISIIFLVILTGILLYIYFSRKRDKINSNNNGEYLSNFKTEKSTNNEHVSTFNREKTDKLLKKYAKHVKGSKETPIYIIENFLTDEECQGVIDSSKGKLVKSPLTREDPNDLKFRTSKTCFFDGTGIQNHIEDKILDNIQFSKENCESSQIQHYLKGNEFKAHYDYFHSEHGQPYLKNGQRTWTFMVYLNDVEKG